MIVTIVKSDIYAHVVALTARIGKAGGDYAGLAATSDNEAMLNLYLTPAISEAESILHKELGSSNDLQLKDTGSSIELSFKNRLAGVAKGIISTQLRLFVAYYVVASWLFVTPTGKELGEQYKEMTGSFLNNVRNALYMRPTISITEYKRKRTDDCWARRGVFRTSREVMINEEGLPVMDESGSILLGQ